MKTCPRKLLSVFAALTLFGAVAACSGPTEVTSLDNLVTPEDERKTRAGSVFGEDGFTIGGRKRLSPGETTGIGVNSFLWRASLDTILFMPVTSADPFGGVIITDWYTPADTPENERFKLNVYILGRALRADGVKVSVFRQVQDPSGTWRDSSVPDETAIKIEDAILMKARQLRYETVEQ